jgi:hypothetical protein
MQSPAAVSSPDFFPAKRAATPPPAPQQQQDEFEIFFPYEDELLDQEVNVTDPSPPIQHLLCQHSHRRCTTSSSSSAYGDNAEVTTSDPSPPVPLTYAQIATRPRQRLSSSSSTSTHLSLPSDGVASRTSSCSRSLTPER